jgi:hypothetical protein
MSYTGLYWACAEGLPDDDDGWPDPAAVAAGFLSRCVAMKRRAAAAVVEAAAVMPRVCREEEKDEEKDKEGAYDVVNSCIFQAAFLFPFIPTSFLLDLYLLLALAAIQRKKVEELPTKAS